MTDNAEVGFIYRKKLAKCKQKIFPTQNFFHCDKKWHLLGTHAPPA
jgi:hypothetical protein